jgi:hypothetical protein
MRWIGTSAQASDPRLPRDGWRRRRPRSGSRPRGALAICRTSAALRCRRRPSGRRHDPSARRRPGHGLPHRAGRNPVNRSAASPTPSFGPEHRSGPPAPPPGKTALLDVRPNCGAAMGSAARTLAVARHGAVTALGSCVRTSDAAQQGVGVMRSGQRCEDPGGRRPEHRSARRPAGPESPGRPGGGRRIAPAPRRASPRVGGPTAVVR